MSLDSSSASVVAARPLRIRHVDSLRAIAAGLVVWFHLEQTLRPVVGRTPSLLGFLSAVPRALDIGRVGVMIFFAVSGFVICRSFGGPREGGGRRFLIKRFCRLYPAYWVSMLGGILVYWLTDETLTWRILLTNALMLSGTFDQPRLLGVYWTLEIELLFYALCLGLYWLRRLDYRPLLATLVVFLAWTPRLLKIIDHHAGTHLTLPFGKPTMLLSLGMMFWGALFRQAYDETGGFRHDVLKNRGVWLVAALALALLDLPDPNLKWFLMGLLPSEPMPTHVAVLLALTIFTLWVAWLRIDNAILTYLGVISYSLYLFHPVPKYVVLHLISTGPFQAGQNLPFWVYLLGCLALAVGLAAAVYRWVERPAIALGKRWANSNRPTEPI